MVLLDAPRSLGVLEELEVIDVDDLTASELGAVLVSIRLVRGRVDACEARVLAAFERVGGAKKDGAVDTKAWLAHRTKVSRHDATRAVQRAVAITALPALGDLLSSGAVSSAHVEAIGAIVPDKLLPSAGPLVEAAKTSTPEQLRQQAHRLVMDADNDKGASRSEKQRAAQKLSFFDRDDGMGAAYGQWAPERRASIEEAIDLVADDLWRAEHPNRNPQRWDANTLKYRRAEALYQLARRVLARRDLLSAGATGVSSPPAAPVENGERAENIVNAEADTAPSATAHSATAHGETDDTATANTETATAATAHGRSRPESREYSDAELTAAARASARGAKPLAMLLIDYHTARGELASRRVCELGDGTPINPDTMRRLLCDAAIIPAVLNDRGEVLDMGRKIYLPTMAQRRAVFLRDRHCQFPGCNRPAKWSDVHHIVWWDTGGRTDYANLLLLCGHHHHLVHEGGWRIRGSAADFSIYRPDGELFERVTRGPP